MLCKQFYDDKDKHTLKKNKLAQNYD